LKIFALTMKVCIDRDFAIITGLIGVRLTPDSRKR
jgi:hypothetical protein